MYNFDMIIDRHNTHSIKWDSIKENACPPDTLAMGTADMDFEVCSAVAEALARRAAGHRIYGYSTKLKGCDEAVCDWMKKRHGWEPRPEWILNTPGVVCALKMIIQCFTCPDDGILITRPVYYPFMRSIEGNGRRIVNSPLLRDGSHYDVDFDDFEEKIRRNGVTMFLLCNPHNPVGRVWTADELRRMGEICARHHVLIVADEIHCDFTFAPHRFVPFLVANPHLENEVVVCTAPSKTFNLPGLKYSNIFVPSREKRKKLLDHLERCGITTCNLFGYIACKAAYTRGASWFDGVLKYLKRNSDFFRESMARELPMMVVSELQGTYLAWVDFSVLGLSDKQLYEFMIYDAHVRLDDGIMFGPEGSGFQRFNLGCPRSVIGESVTRIKRAADARGLI